MAKHLMPPGSDIVQRPAQRWQESSTRQVFGTRRSLDTPELDDTLLDGGLRALSREEIRRQRSMEQARSTGFADHIQMPGKKDRGAEAEKFFHLLGEDESSEFLL